MSLDPHLVDGFRVGFTRLGVVDPWFDKLILAGRTVPVKHWRRIVDATSDLYTGHPNVSWEESTVDAQVLLGPAGREETGIGSVGMVDGVIKSADPLFMLDRFDYEGLRYELASPPMERRGRDGGFLYRVVGFKKVEFEEV